VSKVSDHRDAITAYIRRLGNPYAKQQLIGVEEDEQQGELALRNADLDLRPATAHERAYARRQGNQYTLLSVAIPDPKEALAAGGSLVEQPKEQLTPRASLSKSDFNAGCRRIFRHYIPSVEKGRLRRHYRDFITRNQGHSPSVRYTLLQELSKYDLSAVAGMETRFNRERGDLTDQKLKQIERSALAKESK
jgi:hypothetical protein